MVFFTFAIIKKLIEDGATIKAYDPVAEERAKNIFNEQDITYCRSVDETILKAEAILLLTRWEEFIDLPAMLKSKGMSPLLIDGRRMLPITSVERYEGIGLE